MNMLVCKRSKERCCPRQPERQLVQMFTRVGNKFDMKQTLKRVLGSIIT